MALYQHISEGDLQVYVWRQDETPEQLYALLGSNATELRLTAEHRFASVARRGEWLAVRVLLQSVLGAHVRILYRRNGEPYLTGATHAISISHTKGYVAIALHPARAVGVDIEYFSSRINKLTSRIMNANEQPAESLDGPSLTWYNLLVWSMKETLFKGLNVSELDYLNGITLKPFRLEQQGEAQATYAVRNYIYPVRVHYRRTSDFVLTWYVEG